MKVSKEKINKIYVQKVKSFSQKSREREQKKIANCLKGGTRINRNFNNGTNCEPMFQCLSYTFT